MSDSGNVKQFVRKDTILKQCSIFSRISDNPGPAPVLAMPGLIDPYPRLGWQRSSMKAQIPKKILATEPVQRSTPRSPRVDSGTLNCGIFELKPVDPSRSISRMPSNGSFGICTPPMPRTSMLQTPLSQTSPVRKPIAPHPGTQIGINIYGVMEYKKSPPAHAMDNAMEAKLEIGKARLEHGMGSGCGLGNTMQSSIGDRMQSSLDSAMQSDMGSGVADIGANGPVVVKASNSKELVELLMGPDSPKNSKDRGTQQTQQLRQNKPIGPNAPNSNLTSTIPVKTPVDIMATGRTDNNNRNNSKELVDLLMRDSEDINANANHQYGNKQSDQQYGKRSNSKEIVDMLMNSGEGKTSYVQAGYMPMTGMTSPAAAGNSPAPPPMPPSMQPTYEDLDNCGPYVTGVGADPDILAKYNGPKGESRVGASNSKELVDFLMKEDTTASSSSVSGNGSSASGRFPIPGIGNMNMPSMMNKNNPDIDDLGCSKYDGVEVRASNSKELVSMLCPDSPRNGGDNDHKPLTESNMSRKPSGMLEMQLLNLPGAAALSTPQFKTKMPDQKYSLIAPVRLPGIRLPGLSFNRKEA